MSRKSKIIGISFIVLFFIWIAKGPQLLSNLREDGEFPLHDTEYVQYGYRGDVTYSLDAIDYKSSSYREVIGLKGWCFIELDRNIKQRKISILLLSEDRSYKVETTISNKLDIAKIYEPGNSESIIADFGFDTKFSAVTMENGEYRIALAVEENSNKKIEYIGKILKKEAGIISFIDDTKTDRISFTEFKDSISNLPEATGYVDILADIGDQTLYINGWACKEVSQDVKTREIYAILKSSEHAYNAPLQSISRYGLVEFLYRGTGIENILNPAYKGKIYFKDIKDGNYDLFILVNENSKHYLQSVAVTVEKNGRAISVKGKE